MTATRRTSTNSEVILFTKKNTYSNPAQIFRLMAINDSSQLISAAVRQSGKGSLEKLRRGEQDLGAKWLSEMTSVAQQAGELEDGGEKGRMQRGAQAVVPFLLTVSIGECVDRAVNFISIHFSIFCTAQGDSRFDIQSTA